MKLFPGQGLDGLVFGMKVKDITDLIGPPDRQFKDDEQNDILLFNALRLRLTFYEDEDYKMGYIMCSHPGLELDGVKLIGVDAAELRKELDPQNKIKWEKEFFDTAENFLNPVNWLTIQSEFGITVKAELGALIDSQDEFVWKFKTK